MGPVRYDGLYRTVLVVDWYIAGLRELNQMEPNYQWNIRPNGRWVHARLWRWQRWQ